VLKPLRLTVSGQRQSPSLLASPQSAADRRHPPSRLLPCLSYGLFVLAALWWLYRPMFLVEVQGISMRPTYTAGQLLIAMPIGHVQRGDVVIAQTDEGTLIKRIAYIGGTDAPAPPYPLHYTNAYQLFAQPGRLGKEWRSRVPISNLLEATASPKRS